LFLKSPPAGDDKISYPAKEVSTLGKLVAAKIKRRQWQ
jgi:hypothetical protein